MIVVDTSALAAIYFVEADAAQFAEALWAADETKISAGTVLELSIVLATRKVAAAAEAERWLDDFLEEADIAVEPVDALQLQIARTAYALYGKGLGHPAQLTSATALHTRWRRLLMHRCCSKARISRRRICVP